MNLSFSSYLGLVILFCSCDIAQLHPVGNNIQKRAVSRGFDENGNPTIKTSPGVVSNSRGEAQPPVKPPIPAPSSSPPPQSPLKKPTQQPSA